MEKLQNRKNRVDTIFLFTTASGNLKPGEEKEIDVGHGRRVKIYRDSEDGCKMGDGSDLILA